MALADIIEHGGVDKQLLLPAQHYFQRRFDVGSPWTDLYIGAGFAVANLDGDYQGSNYPPTEDVSSELGNKFFFGIKKGTGFIGETDVRFWGLMSPRLSQTAEWRQDLGAWKTYTAAGSATSSSMALGEMLEDTNVAEMDTAQNYVGNGAIVTSGSNLQHSMCMMCAGNPTAGYGDKSFQHTLRLRKINDTTLNLAYCGINPPNYTTEIAPNTAEEMQSKMVEDLTGIAGKEITVDTVENVPDTFFVYAPWATARLRINCMVIFKNA